MAKQKWTIYIGLVLLTSLAILLCLISTREETAPFSLELATEEGQEQILLWKQESGGYYGFLPAFSEMENTYIRLNTDNPVKLNGILLENGMDCSAFSADEPQILTYTAWGRERTDTVTFLRSANIASMYIDTQSGNMEYIHEKKGNEEAGNLRLYTPEGAMDYTGRVESINGRGNFTWLEYEKKPYSLKLVEAADLLGLGKAQKWVLLANAGDPTNLRNKMIYDFAATVRLEYSPQTQWVDLYLNGEYAGLYLLSERNEVHPERVSIVNENSYLVSQEVQSKMDAQNYTYILTQAGQALRVHYPLLLDEAKLEEMTKQFQSMENAILAEDGIDPITGKTWQELIDIDSWARKYLIEEIFGNSDAGSISQYFYVDGTETNRKIYAGPVWDYDRTMGNEVAWHLRNPQTFFANRLNANENYEIPWLFMLYQKEAFYNRVIELYQKEFLPQVEMLLDDTVQSYAAIIEQACRMNYFRWFTGEEYLDLQIDEIKKFMDERIAFLNRVWINNDVYYQVRADHGFGSNYAHYVVFTGEHLPELPTFDDTETHSFTGWYYADTDEPFDPETPITEDIEIYAKWEETPTKRIKQVAKLMPLGVIAVMGATLVVIEVRRWRKRR